MQTSQLQWCLWTTTLESDCVAQFMSCTSQLMHCSRLHCEPYLLCQHLRTPRQVLQADLDTCLLLLSKTDQLLHEQVFVPLQMLQLLSQATVLPHLHTRDAL